MIKSNFEACWMSLKPVKVIAISSGKGGVGKSHTSLSLAIALAQKGKKVLLLDADLGLPNLDVMLGLHSKYNLDHVLQGKCQLNDIIIQGPSGVFIIPGASTGNLTLLRSATEYAGIIHAFDHLAGDWDYLIIDTAAGISDVVLSFACSAQEIITIVCNEPASLSGAYSFIKNMNQLYRWKKYHVLANMIRKESEGQELFKKFYSLVEQFLDVHLNYLGAIPFDERVHEAIRKQESIITAFPNATASRALRQLADKIDHWPFPSTLSGNTSFFLERTAMGSGE